MLYKEAILFRFYKYLSISGINSKNNKILEKIDRTNSLYANKRSKKVTPFDEIHDIIIKYPNESNKPRPLLKDQPEELWELFIEFAELNYPNISFGIVLSICGGIRRGECVNLLVRDININQQNRTLYLNIQDRQIELFGERDINLNNSQVKKPRKKQPVLSIHSHIVELFESHKARLCKIYGTTNIANYPLFVNADGNSMSGDSFSGYFNRLKASFIEFLIDEGLQDKVETIKYYKWGTHIGRHIFTNFIVKNGYANGTGNKPIAKLVAILRGDSCEESSNTYIDTFTIGTAIQANINDISKIAMENYKNENE